MQDDQHSDCWMDKVNSIPNTGIKWWHHAVWFQGSSLVLRTEKGCLGHGIHLGWAPKPPNINGKSHLCSTEFAWIVIRSLFFRLGRLKGGTEQGNELVKQFPLGSLWSCYLEWRSLEFLMRRTISPFPPCQEQGPTPSCPWLGFVTSEAIMTTSSHKDLLSAIIY
jgi:hypothetical protein